MFQLLKTALVISAIIVVAWACHVRLNESKTLASDDFDTLRDYKYQVACDGLSLLFNDRSFWAEVRASSFWHTGFIYQNPIDSYKSALSIVGSEDGVYQTIIRVEMELEKLKVLKATRVTGTEGGQLQKQTFEKCSIKRINEP